MAGRPRGSGTCPPNAFPDDSAVDIELCHELCHRIRLLGVDQGQQEVLWCEDDVAPCPVVATHPFAGADDAEPGALVQGEAGGVLGEDAGLHRSDAGGVGGGEQGGQQGQAHPAAAGVGVDGG